MNKHVKLACAGLLLSMLVGYDLTAVLRGAEKGGKSSGLVENVLTDEARVHPWFGRLSRELPDRRHFRVLDSRLYDLIPHGPIAAGLIALSHEALGHDGPETAALTGREVERA